MRKVIARAEVSTRPRQNLRQGGIGGESRFELQIRWRSLERGCVNIPDKVVLAGL
jgi:hypothetical protein